MLRGAGGEAALTAPRGDFIVCALATSRTFYCLLKSGKIAAMHETAAVPGPFHDANVAHVLITNTLTYHHNPD